MLQFIIDETLVELFCNGGSPSSNVKYPPTMTEVLGEFDAHAATKQVQRSVWTYL